MCTLIAPPGCRKGLMRRTKKSYFFPSIIYRSHPCKLRKRDIKNFRKFISQEQHNIIRIKGVKLSVFKLTFEIVRQLHSKFEIPTAWGLSTSKNQPSEIPETKYFKNFFSRILDFLYPESQNLYTVVEICTFF